MKVTVQSLERLIYFEILGYCVSKHHALQRFQHVVYSRYYCSKAPSEYVSMSIYNEGIARE